MQKLIKHVITCLLAGILIFSSVGCAKTTTSKKLSDYNKYVESVGNAIDLMPALEDFGDYKNAEFRYYLDESFFIIYLASHGLSLFVEYDNDDYNEIKETALFVNDFLTEPVYLSFTKYYELPVTELDYKGFHLMVVPDYERFDYCACQSFGMFGYNDETKTVVFLYFYDADLDLIAEPGDDLEAEMTEFSDRSFLWL